MSLCGACGRKLNGIHGSLASGKRCVASATASNLAADTAVEKCIRVQEEYSVTIPGLRGLMLHLLLVPAHFDRLQKKYLPRRSRTSVAKAGSEHKPVIAAVNRCATQNQVQH